MKPATRRTLLKRGGAAIVGVSLVSSGTARPDALLAIAASIQRQLRFSISLRNPTGAVLRDQALWLYAPADRGSTQRLKRLAVSSEHELLTDALGHRIIKLAFPEVAPLASKVVTVIADVQLSMAPPTEVLSDPRAWLLAERFVEVDDDGIRALAAQLKRSNERATTRAIYDWVRSHLRYAGYVADDLGALYALMNRRGDCTEYAYLAVALARANGIPARMLGGYVTDRNDAPRAEAYHNWAEVYFEGAWHLLDAQKENWLTPSEQYVTYRICHERSINPIGLAHRYSIQGGLDVTI